jgi:3'(2'), 5'-bisphosphate nucleotidase
MDPRSDAEISRDVAQVAGQLLLELRDGFGPIDDKDAAHALRKLADRTSHERIMELLSAARPDDAILSEEGKDDVSRLDAERVWIVDPLDGTWEYGQGRIDFAVHIALWEPRERRLSAATVDLPAQGVTRSVLDTFAAPEPLPTDRPIRIVASRNRPPDTLPQTVEILGELLAERGINSHGVEIVDVGSVGAKVNEILSGRAEAYVHDTGFFEWDVAAPYGVASHYGLVPSHISGQPVIFNQMPPYVTDLTVSHPDLVRPLRMALERAAS